jgi:hypothetical protein
MLRDELQMELGTDDEDRHWTSGANISLDQALGLGHKVGGDCSMKRLGSIMGWVVLLLAGCAPVEPSPTHIPSPTPKLEMFEEIGQCGLRANVRVWLDENEDGIWDETELPLASIPVEVTYVHPEWASSGAGRTDATGSRSLMVDTPCGLATYRIEILPDERYRTTTPSILPSVSVQDEGPLLFGLTYASDDVVPGTAVPAPPDVPELSCESHDVPGMSGWISEIAPGQDGEIWVAHNGGVGVWQPESGEWKSLELAGAAFSDLSIRSVTPDVDGSLWVINWEGELARFDGQDWHHRAELSGLQGESVRGVHIAPDNRVWFVTSASVFSWDRGDTWVHYAEEDGLFGTSGKDVIFGPGGDIWFTDHSATSRLHLDTDREANWTVFPENEAQRVYDHLGYDTAFLDTQGQIWFGGQRFYDPGSDIWRGSTYADFAYDFVVDEHGRLWVARGDHVGLIFIADPLNDLEGYWHIYEFKSGNQRDVSRLYLDGSTLWIGAKETLMSCQIEGY